MLHKKQRGASLLNIVLGLIVVGFLAVVVVRLVPAFTEYKAIARTVKFAAGGASSEDDVRKRYTEQIRMEGVYEPSVLASDLKITLSHNTATVEFAYRREVEFLGPIALLVKFDGVETGTRY